MSNDPAFAEMTASERLVVISMGVATVGGAVGAILTWIGVTSAVPLVVAVPLFLVGMFATMFPIGFGALRIADGGSLAPFRVLLRGPASVVLWIALAILGASLVMALPQLSDRIKLPVCGADMSAVPAGDCFSAAEQAVAARAAWLLFCSAFGILSMMTRAVVLLLRRASDQIDR